MQIVSTERNSACWSGWLYWECSVTHRMSSRMIGLVFAVSCLLAGVVCQGPASGPISGASQTPNTAFSANNAPVVAPGGWREGRATFYDAPTYFQQVRAGAPPFFWICSVCAYDEQLLHRDTRHLSIYREVVESGAIAGFRFEGSRCIWKHTIWWLPVL